MQQEIFEIIVHGSHAAGMANFLVEHGALLLRKDPPNNYVFINDTIFENAQAELQIAIRQGFYFADKEVKSD